MNLMLIGAIAVTSLVIALFFLRFWKNTRDRFFLFFATSFFIEGVNRAVLGLTTHPDEGQPFFYLVRLLSFALIIAAIIDKNWTRRPRVVTAARSSHLVMSWYEAEAEQQSSTDIFKK